ncbi:MAG: TRAP transporter large permease subunit, partial [Lachnospiraceae bacterium]|nr:TRAP transporter large permease subunit [Lachnospiraceae bacterium]
FTLKKLLDSLETGGKGTITVGAACGVAGIITTATYCIMAATCAPILTRMGVPILAAHLFVFYFGIVADITPPVALAAYAGSAIAKSDPIRTAVNATKLAIAAFIIPYVFCYSPDMLLLDADMVSVVALYATSLVGVAGVAAALEGYLFTDMSIVDRLMLIAGGLLMIFPGTTTDTVGLVLIAAAVVLQKLRVSKARS